MKSYTSINALGILYIALLNMQSNPIEIDTVDSHYLQSLCFV